SVTYMAATGVSAAATVRVGFEYGRKDKQDLRRAGYTAIGLTLILMGASALLFTLFHTFLPSIMTNDPEVVHIASLLLCMVAFFQLSDGVQVVSMGALRGMGDVVIPSSVAFSAYWLIGLPLGWVLAFKMGWEVYGIWVGLTTGLVFASIVLLLRFIKKSKSVVFEEVMN
ncbi:MAG: MATE family efflux transporter, partial [Cytophagales bacterium]|nr:MATE family efflux transporter [Cytophaga sp.]